MFWDMCFGSLDFGIFGVIWSFGFVGVRLRVFLRVWVRFDGMRCVFGVGFLTAGFWVFMVCFVPGFCGVCLRCICQLLGFCWIWLFWV